MTKTQHPASPLQAVDALLRSLTKSGEEARTEAGGHDGPTEHPIKNVDDSTIEAPEGARSKENDKDVKEQVGAPAVDGKQKEAVDGTESITAVGLQSRPTGEDAANETASAKGGKEDGGTRHGKSSHPARTDNNDLDGCKYAAEIASLRKKIAAAIEIGNDALAAISIEAPKADGSDATAKTAGAELAAALSAAGGEVPAVDKQAQMAQVVDDLAATILASYSAAQKTAEYIAGVYEGLREQQAAAEKQAADRAYVLAGARQLVAAKKQAATRKAPPAKAAAEGAAEPAEEPPAADAGPSDGGEPPAEPASEAPPMPAAGGENVSPADLQMLLQLLQEAGVTPEQLVAAAGDAGGEGGAGGGDLAGGMGGPPGLPPAGPEGAPPMAPPMAAADGMPPKMAADKTAKPRAPQKSARAQRVADAITDILR